MSVIDPRHEQNAGVPRYEGRELIPESRRAFWTRGVGRPDIRDHGRQLRQASGLVLISDVQLRGESHVVSKRLRNGDVWRPNSSGPCRHDVFLERMSLQDDEAS